MAERVRAPKNGGAEHDQIERLSKSRRKSQKAPGAGHNSGIVPEEVVQRWIGRIEETDLAMTAAKAVYDQAKGVHQSVWKAAKKEGINPDAMRDARAKHKASHATVVQNAHDEGRYLRAMGSPLGSQFGLFDFLDKPQMPVDEAKLQGEHAGRNGEPRENNTHTPGSEAWFAWNNGWQVGQDAIAETLGKGNDGAGAAAH